MASTDKVSYMNRLAVSGVDFRIARNAQDHLTSRYESVHLDNPSAVLRRGQEFTIQVNFRNGSFDPSIHRLSIVFDLKNVGSPDPVTGTRGEALVNADTRFGWKATLMRNNGNYLVVKVQSPSTAPVGEWSVRFVTLYQQGRSHDYIYPGNVYLLFNPWNSADQVHMPETQLLDEYVFNDVGKIYKKDGDVIKGQHWEFGQYAMSALLATMKALELSDLQPHERGNPVKVSRAVTYMANASSNPNGILEWMSTSDDLPQPGTRPWEWTSSLQVINEYLQHGRPVKYGQCWVFGGIIATVCRALGLPTRVVTTMDSAHDGDHDLALSKFYDENNEETMHPIYSRGSDQQWSFHVWNETWMARPDLPRGYGGWQAIDGTPQDENNGKYQCGPAPLEAIRRGEVGMPHEVGTFIAATNADLIHWKKTNDGRYEITKVETDRYGTSIVTKKPYTFDPNGETDMDDITLSYKFSEGSQSERMFLMNAVRQVANARAIYNVRRESWHEELDFTAVNVSFTPLGQELVIPFKVKNKSGGSRSLKTSITAVSMYYNGMKGHHLGKVEETFNLRPGGEETIFLRLRQRDYVGKLVEYGSVHVYGATSVADTNQTWIEEMETGFRVPAITFDPLQNVRVGQRNSLRVNLRNPMNVALTGCKFLFFAPGVNVVREIQFRNINPQEQISMEVYFQPVMQGVHTLSATFMCRETVNFRGRVYIRV